MERKALLVKYVKSVMRRLRLEQSVRMFQTSLFGAVLLAVLIVAASRLFVFPHYGRIALVTAVLVLVAATVFLFYKRCRLPEAVRRLDGYMPDNLLITAIDVKATETHLAPALIQAAESQVADAFEKFKRRREILLECENAYRFPTIIRSPCSASSVPFRSPIGSEWH